MLRSLLLLIFCGVCAVPLAAQANHRFYCDGHIDAIPSICLLLQSHTVPAPDTSEDIRQLSQSDAIQALFSMATVDALRPWSHKIAKALEASQQPLNLSSTDRLQCQWLLRMLPSLERHAASAPSPRKADDETALEQARRKFQDLKC